LLPAEYSAPLTPTEQKIHAHSLSELVTQCRSGALSPSEILMTYAKPAVQAQKATNCVSDIMFQESLLIPPVANWDAEVDAESSSQDAGRGLSLMGVPVSIKGAPPFATRRCDAT